MDSYSYNAYARYYDKNFPSDFQRRCNESAARREDYQLFFNQKFPVPLSQEKVLDIGINPGVQSGINPSPKVD